MENLSDRIKDHLQRGVRHCEKTLSEVDIEDWRRTYFTAIKNEYEWMLELYFGVKPKEKI